MKLTVDLTDEEYKAILDGLEARISYLWNMGMYEETWAVEKAARTKLVKAYGSLGYTPVDENRTQES